MTSSQSWIEIILKESQENLHIIEKFVKEPIIETLEM